MFSDCRENSRQKSGASRHGADNGVFVRGMSAVADSAEAIERGDAERAGEITIGAAANRAFAKRKIHLLREGFGVSEERSAHFAF